MALAKLWFNKELLAKKTKLDLKVRSCKKCGLYVYRKSNSIVGEYGSCQWHPRQYRLCMIIDRPNLADEITGVPLSGKRLESLYKIIDESGIDSKWLLKDSAIFSLIKCPLYDFEQKFDEKYREETMKIAYDNCKPYLVEQLKMVIPDYIVIFGNRTQKIMFDRILTGTIYTVQIYGRPVKTTGCYEPKVSMPLKRKKEIQDLFRQIATEKEKYESNKRSKSSAKRRM
jgi:uracil-DNA glycosylase family 4